MARDREVVDDDGNIIPTPPADHPVMAFIYLIEYGRKRGFRIGPTVQIGDTIVQVRDMRLKEDQPAPVTPERTIWQENGLDEDK